LDAEFQSVKQKHTEHISEQEHQVPTSNTYSEQSLYTKPSVRC